MQAPLISLLLRLVTLIALVAQPLCAEADPLRAERAKQSLDDYSTLVIGVLADGADPFGMLFRGQPVGMSIDVLRELTGSHVAFQARAYPDMASLIDAACDGEVDIVTNVTRSADRGRCLTFTVPYVYDDAVLIGRNGAPGRTPEDRTKRTVVAVEEGFTAERPVGRQFPSAEIRRFPNRSSALNAVVSGAADMYMGVVPDAEQLLATPRYKVLTILPALDNELSEARFAVPSGRSTLRNDLNRRLLRIDPVRLEQIRERWPDGVDAASAGARKLVLSADERAYLRSLPVISLGFDTDWAPFTYLDSARQPSGIATAYVAYLSKALDIRFERRMYPNWRDLSNGFAHGQVEMMATTQRETPRLTGGIATQSYESYPLVIVGRDGEPVVKGMAEIASRRVVVTERLAASGRLGNLGAQSGFVVAPTLMAALDRVASGEADLFVGDLGAVDLALAARYEDELKILGPAGDFEHVGFALRPEFKRLVPLIDRALRTMPEADKQQILAARKAAFEKPSGWSVSALRLLPALIAIGVVLAVTLRAFVLLLREMGRRIETEERLATQLSFQQTMMEVVPYPLVVKDLDNRYIAVNRAFENTLGVRREDIVGATTMEVQSWGAEYSEQLHQLAAKSIANEQREQVEIEFRNRAGETRHGLFWTGTFSAADGTMAGVVGTMIDITDIRDAEMRARENERRLHHVTRSLPAVVFQLRRALDGLYSFPYIGGDTRHLFGADLTAFSSIEIAEMKLIHADDRRSLREMIERSAATLEPVHVEFRSSLDGGCRWIRADLVAHREADGAVIWSGYWVDASIERGRADELARARDAAEAASRAKDDFLAMMSHEIRTPMNGVLGLVEVFETTPLNADQSQMLGMIQDSASALLQILDDLLDYSKIEAGRLTIESMPIDLRELVDNAVGLLAGRAHEKGLRVRVDVAPGIAASLLGDSVRLRQVLFNLLSNAIKFTMKGEVSLTVALVETADDVQTVKLSVEDTGIGIRQEAQASLFEPFVQAESSTTRRFGGTGLGLTICRKLVALMGGTLELQSELGVGTCMIVQLAMPVETMDYQIDGLRGKQGIIAIEDANVARALVDFGQALGLNLRVLSCDDPSLRVPGTFDGIDLVFLREGHPEALPLKSRVIHVTEKPKPTGYRILDNGIRVSVNPITWRGLGAACIAALTGLPQIAARGARGIEANTAPPDRERAIRTGRLVLVAEDHPVNQELIRHQLSLLGFACDVVPDGAEALAALRKTHYGFLITDCHMPNMTGYELARRVRASELGLSKRLPILGITASTAPEELAKCRDAGMDDCFVKPTRLATLRAHLNRWRGAESAAVAVEPDSVAQTFEQSATAVAPVSDEVDLAYMTQLWGSEATVKALLSAFASSFRDDLGTLRPLLERSSIEPLREWHHRVIGAASVLQYRPLIDALDNFRRDLSGKPQPERRSDGIALIERCEALLERIDAQCAALT